ncbi:hypothetical protein [Mariniblastus fucicola]|uniref:DUF1579 domain-containing protein n=1 Tax=Mariniblastus fucicola TaxID=980251 RepID=A0A5B9P3W6_9BACT|nr:hypothetical protein [Mariniblastus fucicola]QEG21098.1 hypothetical protein MFFC18_09500 [Mariniblastus fucicola]
MTQKCFRVLLFVSICIVPTFAIGQEKTAAKQDSVEAVEAADIGSAPDQKAIDNLKKFLEGSKWNGTFTMRKSGDKLHTEEYEIVSAEKEPTGDEWMLVAKIKYMKKDVKVPVGLSIKWIDRTPVIVLDQVTIPGMGTFDSRVIIRKGMYAGTWAHGKVGGHMFGNITTAAAAAAADEDAKSKESK